jgi:hypothetical protein
MAQIPDLFDLHFQKMDTAREMDLCDRTALSDYFYTVGIRLPFALLRLILKGRSK